MFQTTNQVLYKSYIHSNLIDPGVSIAHLAVAPCVHHLWFRVLRAASDGHCWGARGLETPVVENDVRNGMFMVISLPICSMYGIFTNIYPINDPNVGKYTIHGAYGLYFMVILAVFHGNSW
jgi:hypothetical protein